METSELQLKEEAKNQGEEKEPEPLLIHRIETVGSDGDMPREG